MNVCVVYKRACVLAYVMYVCVILWWGICVWCGALVYWVVYSVCVWCGVYEMVYLFVEWVNSVGCVWYICVVCGFMFVQCMYMYVLWYVYAVV